MFPSGPGTFAPNTRTTSTSGTILLTDAVVRVDTTAGTRVLTLPPAAQVRGQMFTLKKIVAANTLTLAANGAELIDGFNTTDLTTQYSSIAVQSNGSSWDVLFRV